MICQEISSRYLIRKIFHICTFDYHDLGGKIVVMKCLICGKHLKRLGAMTCSPKHRVALMRLRDVVADELRCDRTDPRVDVEIRLIQQERFPDENSLILNRLERIENLLLSSGNRSTLPSVTLPEDDIIVKQVEGENSAFNVILATLALGADFKRFPPEVIEYGIMKGVIDPKYRPLNGGSIKQMEVNTDLPAPEEFDLDW